MQLPEVEPTYNPHPVPVTDDLKEFAKEDYQKVVIRLRDVEREVYEMHRTLASMEKILSEIKDVLQPALDGIANSPIGSMLGLKKG